jgi:hypothetical protein
MILQSKIPLVHEVIPIFDILSGALDEFINDSEGIPAVRAAAYRGVTIMNKYYALTDNSVVYRIAMSTYSLIFMLASTTNSLQAVLHPRYKTTYFTKAKWPREWIKTAEDLFRQEWETHYHPKGINKPTSNIVRDSV